MQTNQTGLTGVSCLGSVEGLMLTMEISQTYVNKSDHPIELIYTFPIGFKATLLNVSGEIAGVPFKGDVKSNEAAEQEYEETIEKSNSAFKLEVNSSGLLTGRLGNLGINREASIKIKYAEPLEVVKNRVRLTLPFLIDDEMYGRPDEFFNEPENVPLFRGNPSYDFNLKLSVKGDLAQSSVTVPSHPESVITHEEKTSATIVTNDTILSVKFQQKNNNSFYSLNILDLTT